MLNFAISRGKSDIARLLLSRGAVPDARSFVSALQGHDNTFEDLLEELLMYNKLDINGLFDGGQTLLHKDITTDNFDEAHLLMPKYDADPNIRDISLDYPIHRALHRSEPDSVSVRVGAKIPWPPRTP
jgi:ankyrin repeat protein